VLPLGPDLCDSDVVATVELQARERETEIAIFANETHVAAATVPVRGTEVRFRIPARIACRFSPLELAFRNAPSGRSAPSSVRLRIRRLEISTPGAS